MTERPSATQAVLDVDAERARLDERTKALGQPWIARIRQQLAESEQERPFTAAA
jgi:hypothetical protein